MNELLHAFRQYILPVSVFCRTNVTCRAASRATPTMFRALCGEALVSSENACCRLLRRWYYYFGTSTNPYQHIWQSHADLYFISEFKIEKSYNYNTWVRSLFPAVGIENRTIPSPPARMEAGVKSAAKQLGFSARDVSRLDTLHEGISTIRISLSITYRRTKSIVRPMPAMTSLQPHD